MHARLASQTDLAGFRAEAYALLAHQVPPDDVQWDTANAPGSDVPAGPAQAAGSQASKAPRAAAGIVPASFLRLCEMVVLHSEPRRFALLYRLLWRLVHEPALRKDPFDADMLEAQQMAQAVRRDMHRMKTLVRWRPIRAGADAEPLQLAWFDPAHHIVEALAPWFARRFPQLHWAILTPERSVQWDGRQLLLGAGVCREDAPHAEESGEQWLACYQGVFKTAKAPISASRSG